MQRIRLTYSKGDELRYTGNLDMQKVWERIFRRANLKLAYSQGFHPQPRIHQALPLPLTFTSINDLLDFWLDSDESLLQVQQKIEPVLQPGISIQEYGSIPLNDKPLQTQIAAANYTIKMEYDAFIPDLPERINLLLHREKCMRERRGKVYDLKPLILSIETIPFEQAEFKMTLAALPSATGRPEEVLDEMGIQLSDVSIVRTGLLLSNEIKE